MTIQDSRGDTGRPQGPRDAPTSVDPIQDLDAMVAALWARHLKLPVIGPDENFFEAGGDSLSAMRATSELGQALRATIPIITLFEAPTVRGFSARLSALLAETAGGVPPGESGVL